MIKISVIIPVYNSEKYLEECLESVKNQSLKDIEIICINDGSTDNSLELLEKYSKNDDRFKVINQQNSGPSVARNKGIDIAKGKYIFFLDSDDYLLNQNVLDEMYKKIEKDNLEILYFDSNIIFETKELENRFANSNNNYDRTITEYRKIMNGQEFFSKGVFLPCVYLQLTKTEFLKKNNIKFIEDIIHEDNPFCVEQTLYANRIMYVPEKYYCRRYRENSLMTNLNRKKVLMDILKDICIC